MHLALPTLSCNLQPSILPSDPRLSGYLASGRPRYSYSHAATPPLALAPRPRPPLYTSPALARAPARVRQEPRSFNGAHIPFVSLNEEARRRRGEGKVPGLEEVVEVDPRHLQAYLRAGRGANLTLAGRTTLE